MHAVDLVERRLEIFALSRQQNPCHGLGCPRAEQLGHRAPIAVGQIVVVEDDIAGCADREHQQGRAITGAVLAAGAVNEQRIALPFARNFEHTAALAVMIHAEKTVLSDDAPLDLRRIDGTGLHQAQHLQGALGQEAELDRADGAARRQAIGLENALLRKSEIDQCFQSNGRKLFKV